jgi:hypothetical protein
VRTEGEGGAVEEVEQRHLVASAAVVSSGVRAAARTSETIGETTQTSSCCWAGVGGPDRSNKYRVGM